MKRVFSGAQPTGNLHLGNYLGAIRNWVDMQKTFESSLYCIVDLHAITLWQEPQALRKATREVAAAYFAAGIDPQRSATFVQSQCQAHRQLTWILSCVARMGWLNRMTQFKDKAGKDRENASVGLYTYPILMAADILAYHTTHVPVGEDQKQHLELARDIAQKFNNDYGVNFFPLPEPVIGGPAARIMSLRDGTKKMSKSDISEYSRINMVDNAEAIEQKFRKAKTDPHPLPDENVLDEKGEVKEEAEKARPETFNLIRIYAALDRKTEKETIAQFAGKDFSTFKKELAALAIVKLAPIAQEYRRYLSDPAELDRLLAKGAQQAEHISAPILKECEDIVGFLRTK